MSVYSTEAGTIKPLIICGGCSFTHSPDSWAQVLGNHKYIHNDFAGDFFNSWRKYGLEVAGASDSDFAKSVYEYWEDGEDLTDYIEVLVVAQGAAGQDLNGRSVRNAVAAAKKENPDRPIMVFWQLSGWDRIEMMSHKYSTPWHDELYKHDKHMTSVLRPWQNSVTDPDLRGTISGEPIHTTPTPFTPEHRYYWKSGGSVPEQWVGSALEDFTKHYYMDVWTSEFTAVKNLELIEHTRLFCDNLDVPITIFPGWDQTWNRALTLDNIDKQLSAFEILERLPEDIVSDIDGFGGIGEWGSQFLVYDVEQSHRIDDTAEHEIDQLQLEGGSNYEKYWNKETNTFDFGNHPSGHIHALFCNQWIKPKVKKFLESIN